MLTLYSLTIFLSAALLFLVQPMFAKMVLPLLGGSPEVWNTCMVFFQAMLLAGYAYAHAGTRWLGVRRHAVLHVALMLAALAFLPIAVPDGASPPTGQLPIGWLLGVLAVSVGAPFFLVSSTSPLLQRWFAETGHVAAGDPYFLYSASNLGSMLALLGFPLLLEPTLRLASQAWLWSLGYGALMLLVAACALSLRRRPPRTATEPQAAPIAAAMPGVANRRQNRHGKSVAAGGTAARPVDGRRRLWWLGLSLAPSSWLLGVTTYLTTDIAPVPLLWIIPLVLYLLSFILVFARRPLAPHNLLGQLFPLLLMLLAASVLGTGTWHGMLLHLGAFFCAALMCHGELARDRPSPEYLTEFYLWMSLGGVLGGVLNALIAPIAFPWLLEYPLTVALSAWLIARGQSSATAGGRWPRIAALGAVTLLIAWYLGNVEPTERPVWLVMTVIASIVVLALVYLAERPKWFALVLAVPLLLDVIAPPFAGDVLYTGRGYFGIHRVIATYRPGEKNYHHLMHGGTIHGRQSLQSDRQCEPLTYYHPSGPLGEAFEALGGDKRRVSIVGLGSGAMACYCRPEAEFTFYEIDPLVQQIAETPEYFSFLQHCTRGSYRIVLGDGRLQLAAAADDSYDLMIFDAFSSDAVPVHLLTREALALYLRKLAPEGVLLFHTTNTHLDLPAVLTTLAADAELTCRVASDLELTDEAFELGKTPSTYVALARQPKHLGALAASPRWREPQPTRGGRPWTDDFSNILEVLKW